MFQSQAESAREGYPGPLEKSHGQIVYSYVEETLLNTRTLAIAALVLVVIVILFLVL